MNGLYEGPNGPDPAILMPPLKNAGKPAPQGEEQKQTDGNCDDKRKKRSRSPKRTFNRALDKPAEKSNGASAGKQQMQFDDILEHIEDEEDKLVQESKQSKYAASTTAKQDGAYRKYQLICGKKGWDPQEAWNPERITLTAAVFRASANISRSAHTQLANVKARMVSLGGHGGEAEKAYKECFSIIAKHQAPQQEKPILFSFWQQLETGATQEEDEFVGFIAVCWFLMARPDEVGATLRSEGDDSVKFRIGKSKVDQAAKGWEISFKCCCKATKTAGLKRKICPMHACNQQQWNKWSQQPKKTVRGRFMRLIGLAGLPNEKPPGKYQRRPYNLYSIRIGGAQSATLAKTPVEIIKKVGRWKNNSTMEHYQSNVTLSHNEEYALKWPPNGNSVFRMKNQIQLFSKPGRQPVFSCMTISQRQPGNN